MHIIARIVIAGREYLQHHLRAVGVDRMRDSGGNAHARTGIIQRKQVHNFVRGRMRTIILQAELGAPVRCILHGGGAEALHAHLPAATREQNLVLRGLNVWRNQALTPRMT